MTKEDYRIEILKFFDEYKTMLKDAKVPEEEFLNWFYRQQDYESVRAMSRFLFGGETRQKIFSDNCFQWYVQGCYEIYKLFTPDQWTMLLNMGTQHAKVKEFKDLTIALRQKWNTRPGKVRKICR